MLRLLPMPDVLSKAILTVATALTLTCAATAHEVWIEDTPDGKLVVRFAEYGDKYEQSPGALDAVTLPFAWTPAEAPDSKALAASVGGKAPAGEARAILEGQVKTFEVQKRPRTRSRRSRPASR
jgi:hypothetical protein